MLDQSQNIQKHIKIRHISNFQEKTYMSVYAPAAPAGLANPADSYASIKSLID